MPTALTVAEAVLRALAPFVPDKRIAGGSGSAALVLGGRDANTNRAYVHYEIFSGGTGARTGKDGVSATAFHLSNCRTAPIEIIESEFPTRVERFEMIADSGGAGEWRGGLGFARDYRILADDVRFSMRTDKHLIEPFGSDQGRAGGHRRLHRQSWAGSREKRCRRALATTPCATMTSSEWIVPAAAGLAIRCAARSKRSSKTCARVMSPLPAPSPTTAWPPISSTASRSSTKKKPPI